MIEVPSLGVMTPAAFARIASRGKFLCPPHIARLNRIIAGLPGRIRRGESPRILVSMPPRHGKSEFLSKYCPAWFLGSNPDWRVMFASYGAGFASEWGRKVRDLLDEHGQDIFGVKVRKDSKASDRWQLDGREGAMYTAGIGGPFTGRGGQLLLIDDPVKNFEEALSITYRQRAWDWYTSTAYTRVEPGGAIVVIMTRWHDDDLAGKILKNAEAEGESWEVIRFPALAEENDPLGRPVGAALWPSRYSADRLEKIKRTIGTAWFAALYQQRPSPEEGGVFKKPWLRYWTPEGGEFLRLGLTDGKLVPLAHCRKMGIMDLAFSLKKTADYTVITAWAITPDWDMVMLDILRERLAGPELCPAIETMMARWALQYIGVEVVQAQTLLVQEARRRGLTVRALKADTDKITRAIPATIRAEAGQLYLPHRHPLLAEIEHELLTFPAGAHDDIVDTVSYAAAESNRFGAPSVPKSQEEIEREERAARERAREAFDEERERAWLEDDD